MASHPNSKTKYREKTYLGSDAIEKDLNNLKMKFIYLTHWMNEELLGR